MGLFSWGDNTFEVEFDEVELSAPDTVDVGEDFSVEATVKTLGGSDTYWVDDTQLYLETGTGTYFLDRQKMENPIGGAIKRELPFRFQVAGERIEELVEPGESYMLKTYTIFQEFDGDGADDYWDESTEEIRFR